MTKLVLTRDINGYNTFGLAFSSQKYDSTLAANVEQTLTAPTPNVGGYLAVFSYEPGAKVWVALGATATVPGNAFAATDSELNPTARNVPAGGVLHFITNDTTAEVGVSFYELA
jgi:hypothetical protein